MSKIMRELYAEARAAREAAGRADERPSHVTPLTPTSTKASGVEWWVAQYERAGRALAREEADSAVRPVRAARSMNVATLELSSKHVR